MHLSTRPNLAPSQRTFDPSPVPSANISYKHTKLFVIFALKFPSLHLSRHKACRFWPLPAMPRI